MTRRISANSLARAYEALLRSLWRSMHRARREHRLTDALYCKADLNCLLQIRKDARENDVSTPNPSTLAWWRAER